MYRSVVARSEKADRRGGEGNWGKCRDELRRSGFSFTQPSALWHDVSQQRSIRMISPLCRSDHLSVELTPYELRTLRSHRHRPRRESELPERQAAQKKLSRLGYIELKDGVYRITPEGMRLLDRPPSMSTDGE